LSDIETSIWQQYKDQGVTVLGITSDSNDDVLQFVNDHRLTFPILKDVSRVYNSYYLSGGLSPFPRDYIIDQNGIFQYTNTEYDVNAMKLIVASLLDTTTSVSNDEDHSPQSPRQFSLEQNYPNPFNAGTNISYSLTNDVHIQLSVYNIVGEKIAVLDSGKKSTGIYSIFWNGIDSNGNSLPSGLYFYRLEAGEFKSMKKMFLIK